MHGLQYDNIKKTRDFGPQTDCLQSEPLFVKVVPVRWNKLCFLPEKHASAKQMHHLNVPNITARSYFLNTRVH